MMYFYKKLPEHCLTSNKKKTKKQEVICCSKLPKIFGILKSGTTYKQPNGGHYIL